MTQVDLLIPALTIAGVFIANAAIVIPLFFWVRTEARADSRHMDNKLDSYRLETKVMIQAINDEIKDFHNRLCTIEENRKLKG